MRPARCPGRCRSRRCRHSGREAHRHAGHRHDTHRSPVQSALFSQATRVVERARAASAVAGVCREVASQRERHGHRVVGQIEANLEAGARDVVERVRRAIVADVTERRAAVDAASKIVARTAVTETGNASRARLRLADAEVHDCRVVDRRVGLAGRDVRRVDELRRDLVHYAGRHAGCGERERGAEEETAVIAAPHSSAPTPSSPNGWVQRGGDVVAAAAVALGAIRPSLSRSCSHPAPHRR